MADETTDPYLCAAEAYAASVAADWGGLPQAYEIVGRSLDRHLRAAVDAVRPLFEAAGREARDAGPCMDSSPRFEGCTPLLCELRAGHIGGHQSGTASWTKADEVERARSERDAYEAGFAAGRDAARQVAERVFAEHIAAEHPADAAVLAHIRTVLGELVRGGDR